MIVADASAVVEALAGASPSDQLLELVTDEVHAPHLLDTEVLSALRGLVRGRLLGEATAELAVEDYFDLGIHRHEASVLWPRVWELRGHFTSYDAMYLALAEALGCPLVTADAKLLAGHHAEVILVGRSR